jgi:Zn finger protein HypA/HybF involved in hydrogenase expression
MHEWGLVADVVEEVKKQAAANKMIKVTKITISLGKKADLDREGFKVCFEALSKETLMEKAKLQIKYRPDHIITVDSISGTSSEAS